MNTAPVHLFYAKTFSKKHSIFILQMQNCIFRSQKSKNKEEIIAVIAIFRFNSRAPHFYIRMQNFLCKPSRIFWTKIYVSDFFLISEFQIQTKTRNDSSLMFFFLFYLLFFYFFREIISRWMSSAKWHWSRWIHAVSWYSRTSSSLSYHQKLSTKFVLVCLFSFLFSIVTVMIVRRKKFVRV